MKTIIKNASIHGGTYGTTLSNMVPHRIPAYALVSFSDGQQKSYNLEGEEDNDGHEPRSAFVKLWKDCGLQPEEMTSTRKLVGRHSLAH